MRAARAITVPAVAAAIVMAAGCGSDSSGESSSTQRVAIPSVTSPIATAPATTTATAAKPKPKPKPSTTGTTGGSAPCSVPAAYQHLTYNGVSCSDAVALATAWDHNGKQCNTVDNPNVDAGYHRTCSVEGYTCTAKRDVHSDSRFVTCTQGSRSVRFTWLPA